MPEYIDSPMVAIVKTGREAALKTANVLIGQINLYGDDHRCDFWKRALAATQAQIQVADDYLYTQGVCYCCYGPIGGTDPEKHLCPECASLLGGGLVTVPVRS